MLGIDGSVAGSEKGVVWKEFEHSVSYADGRYEAPLPWKRPCPEFVNNERCTFAHLEGLQ